VSHIRVRGLGFSVGGDGDVAHACAPHTGERFTALSLRFRGWGLVFRVGGDGDVSHAASRITGVGLKV